MRRGIKCGNFRLITCYISETVEDRWVHAAKRLTSIELLNSLSIRVTYTAIVPGTYPGEAKMCKKCAKIANLILRLELRENG